MAKLGFARENRPYHPHLTLGRVKSPRKLENVLSFFNSHEHQAFGSMMVKEVVFFRSHLKPQGAEYSKLAEVEFQ